jgi:hypothetical protein
VDDNLGVAGGLTVRAFIEKSLVRISEPTRFKSVDVSLSKSLSPTCSRAALIMADPGCNKHISKSHMHINTHEYTLVHLGNRTNISTRLIINILTNVSLGLCGPSVCACLPACLRACVSACLRACLPACVHVCLCVYVPACVSAFPPACVYVCVRWERTCGRTCWLCR